MTNEHIIRSLMTTKELAELLLLFRSEDEWDCDMDDEWYICGQTEVWITTDGKEFQNFEDALEHECRWLGEEVENV